MRAHTVALVSGPSFLCALSCALIAPALAQTGELPRGGAARPLRLVVEGGAPLPGSATEVAWEERGGGLFFTLEAGGTRNIWRAFPDPQDAGRYPAWRALPVTNLRAPRYAASPAPIPGQRALVCVSNALAGQDAAQIVRFDWAKSTWTALSDSARVYGEPCVDASGQNVAFSGDKNGRSGLFLASINAAKRRALPAIAPLLSGARHPVWLEDDALLFESMAPGPRGLFRLDLSPNARPQLIVSGGGEAKPMAASGVVFAAKTALDAPPRLFLVARDGSGLRVLEGTEGARRPAPSPDGALIAFDAPRDAEPGAPRTLWVLPLHQAETTIGTAPTRATVALIAGKANARDANRDAEVPMTEAPKAQLTAARATFERGIAVVGQLSAPRDARVALEIGKGEKPRQWETLNLAGPSAPALPDGARVLAFWNPPPGARGAWTLRLSVSGLGGAVQSVLRLKLPFPSNAPLLQVPDATRTGAPAPSPQTLPEPPTPKGADNANTPLFAPSADEELPVFPAPVPPSATAPSATATSATATSATATSATATSATATSATATSATATSATATNATATSATATNANAPSATATNASNANARDELPSLPPFAIAQPAVPPQAVPRPAPVAPDVPQSEAPSDARVPAESAARKVVAFAAEFDVVGAPARVAPGEKLALRFAGINRGSATWRTGASGEGRVRLVARWVDFSTNTRRGWNYFWLPEAVAPDARAGRDLSISAPARAGKYKLIFGLVTLPANGEFKPPAWNAPQEGWDDEFAAIAFAVEVAP